jgi:uncharacterized membrane protein
VKRSVLEILSWVGILAGFALAAAAYTTLPDPMPSHFGIDGRPDSYMPKFWGVFAMPLGLAVVWLILLALPRISPRGFEMEPFAHSWRVLRFAVVVFWLFFEVLVFDAARSGRPLATRLLFAAMGLLFAVVGNLLGKITRNFFAGIRTPWTLANEEVWYRTHRLAGKLFVAAGLLSAVAAFFGAGFPILIGSIGLAALVPVAYSYWIYRKLEGRPPATP